MTVIAKRDSEKMELYCSKVSIFTRNVQYEAEVHCNTLKMHIVIPRQPLRK